MELGSGPYTKLRLLLETFQAGAHGQPLAVESYTAVDPQLEASPAGVFVDELRFAR